MVVLKFAKCNFLFTKFIMKLHKCTYFVGSYATIATSMLIYKILNENLKRHNQLLLPFMDKKNVRNYVVGAVKDNHNSTTLFLFLYLSEPPPPTDRYARRKSGKPIR